MKNLKSSVSNMGICNAQQQKEMVEGNNMVHPTFGVMIYRNNNLAIAATFFYYLKYIRKLIAMMYICHQIHYSN